MACGTLLTAGAHACPACGTLVPGAVPKTEAMPEMTDLRGPTAAPPPAAHPAPPAQFALELDLSDAPRTVAMPVASDHPSFDLASTPAMGAPDAFASAPPAGYPEAAPPAAAPAPARPAAASAPKGRRQRGMAHAMTMMAGTALGVSEAFNAGFARPFPGWRAEVAEPMGPSTGGGRQALQPITIESQAGERLAVGRVDPVRRAVVLRTYNVVSTLHGRRYGRAFPVGADDYKKFITQITTFFRAMQFGITDERYVSEAPPAPNSAPGDGQARLLWIILAFMVAIAFALLIFVSIR
jgi:hypothetical protein